MRALLLGLLLSVALAGRSLAEIDVVVPPPVEAAPLESGTTVAPVTLSRMAASIPAGKPWGEAGIANVFGMCVGREPVNWDARYDKFDDPRFQRIFQEELVKLGFKLARDPNDLFADATAMSDLQVGALITDLRARICAASTVTDDGELARTGKDKGSAVMEVEWQVYSASQAKVLARIHTSGGAQIGFSRAPLQPLIERSFAENVRGLAANAEFRALVTARPSGQAQLAAQPLPAQPLPVGYQAATQRVSLADAVTGVVLIRGGEAFGSGVLISADGYILTNHHVTGGAPHVRVRWSNGQEGVADLIRTDPRRDVSLIKIAEIHGTALKIRHRPVALGEPVFAIGAPLDMELQNTLTRGIVSAQRMFEGQAFIQSDTPVTHGNSGGPLLDADGAVVGLTDKGMEPGAGSSLNFFIPIDDALKKLGVVPAAGG